MARCNCAGDIGTGCNCAVVAGDNVTVTGTGQGLDPFVISALTDVDAVRNALSAADGIEYDPDTGVIGPALSVESDNTLTIGPDGGLYVPAGAGALGWVYYTSGTATWAKSAYPRARWLRVRCIGGGGGGAGATSNASQAIARGGGAGGNYAEAWFQVSLLPSTMAVTVGAGGSAGAAANGAGGNGGASSFGAALVANGGVGAPAPAISAAAGTSDGGAPGASGTAQFQSFGQRGGRGMWLSAAIGQAGSGGPAGAGYGSGGRGGMSGAGSSVTGSFGTGPGGGGGGGLSLNTSAAAGGAGAAGAVLVEMFV